MSGGRRRFLRTMVEAVARDDNPLSLLHAICRVATQTIEIDAAIVTPVRFPPPHEPLAANNAWARRLGEAHYVAGDGPTFDACFSGMVITAPHLPSLIELWPGFVMAMAAMDIGFTMAIPAVHDNDVKGALTLFARQEGNLSGEDSAIAYTLSDLTGAVLSSAADKVLLDTGMANIRHRTVQNAAEYLAHRRGISVQDASATMRAKSFATGLSLVNIAHIILRHDRRPDNTGDTT